MGKVIAVASGKGGVGKTTLCAALSLCLSSDYKVLAADCDFGLGNLDTLFSLSDKIVYDVGDVLTGRCEFSRAVLLHPAKRKLHFLPASGGELEDDIGQEAFLDLINSQRQKYEYIFIDCPAGVGRYFKMAVAACDMALIVTTADKNAVRDADRAAYVIEECGAKDISLVINCFDTSQLKKKGAMNIDDIIDATKINLLGVVPEDPALRNAVFSSGEVFLKPSKGLVGIQNIAKRITGQRVPLMKLK